MAEFTQSYEFLSRYLDAAEALSRALDKLDLEVRLTNRECGILMRRFRRLAEVYAVRSFECRYMKVLDDIAPSNDRVTQEMMDLLIEQSHQMEAELKQVE